MENFEKKRGWALSSPLKRITVGDMFPPLPIKGPIIIAQASFQAEQYRGPRYCFFDEKNLLTNNYGSISRETRSVTFLFKHSITIFSVIQTGNYVTDSTISSRSR